MEQFDFTRLDESKHMLEWLHPDPYTDIRTEIQSILNGQVAGSTLDGFQVISNPEWLTGGTKDPSDPSKVIVTRAGVAFSFILQVTSPVGNTEDLSGVYTWVAASLDDPPNAKQKVWFDLGADLSEYGSDEMLKERIYLLEQE